MLCFSGNQADDIQTVRSSVSPGKSDSVLQREEEEDDYDDLFSNIHSNTKKSSKLKSEVNVASNQRNTVNHEDMYSDGNDFLSSNTSLFGNKKTSLFDSPDDDLFSGDNIFSNSSSRKPFKLFDDENLFEENKKSDLFDDLFINSGNTFSESDIVHSEDLFKNKNSQNIIKNDKSSDKKISDNSGTVDYTVKKDNDDLFSSNTLQNTEGGLSRKHFDNEESFGNTTNQSGIKRSSTENLFKAYSSDQVSDSEGIFSHTSLGKQQGLFTGNMPMPLTNKETVSTTQSNFYNTNDGSDNDDIFSSLGGHNKPTSEHNKAFGTLFTNSLSEGASVKPMGNNDSNNSSAEYPVNNVKKPSSIKKSSPNIFEDEDEDDLFKIGSSKTFLSKNKTNLPHQISKNNDNSNILSTKTASEVSDITAVFTSDSDDLFGSDPLNFSGHSGILGTKSVSTTAKSKKLHGTCSLFDDSDSDDDLFSSPRGSLGSKKSQSSVNLSQDISSVLKKNLLEDVSSCKQTESMEYDLFKALRSTSKNNYLFADIISDDEGNDDSNLFSALKPSDSKQKPSREEKVDKNYTATKEILSSSKSEQNVSHSFNTERTNKQPETLTVSPITTEFRSDSGSSLVTENVISPGMFIFYVMLYIFV